MIFGFKFFFLAKRKVGNPVLVLILKKFTVCNPLQQTMDLEV